MDPRRLREINAAKDGTKAAHGPTWANIGYQQTLDAAKSHPNMKIPLGPNQGRGIASGFWFNIGGESAASVHINEDGTASVVEGNPDIGGSPPPMAVMAAPGLRTPHEPAPPLVAGTPPTGYLLLPRGRPPPLTPGPAR